VDLKFVGEFHEILVLLKAASHIDLEHFRIPSEEIHPAVTQRVVHRAARSAREVTRAPYCEGSFFLMKIDGVMGMFELLTNPTPPGKVQIGFNPPGGGQS